jgi:hypothetical protein
MWYFLGWQFPQWLWIIFGIFFSVILFFRVKKLIKMFKGVPIKKTTSSKSYGLPLSLACALFFGQSQYGIPLIDGVQGWILAAIFFVSHFLLDDGIITMDKSSKKSKEKTSPTDDSNSTDEHIEKISSMEGNKLKIEVTEIEGNKKSTVNLNLNNMTFIAKIIAKKMKHKFIDEGIDIEDLYNAAVKNPKIGTILDIETDESYVKISIE